MRGAPFDGWVGGVGLGGLYDILRCGCKFFLEAGGRNASKTFSGRSPRLVITNYRRQSGNHLLVVNCFGQKLCFSNSAKLHGVFHPFNSPRRSVRSRLLTLRAAGSAQGMKIPPNTRAPAQAPAQKERRNQDDDMTREKGGEWGELHVLQGDYTFGGEQVFFWGFFWRAALRGTHSQAELGNDRVDEGGDCKFFFGFETTALRRTHSAGAE